MQAVGDEWAPRTGLGSAGIRLHPRVSHACVRASASKPQPLPRPDAGPRLPPTRGGDPGDCKQPPASLGDV